jgi:hypothetical protein
MDYCCVDTRLVEAVLEIQCSSDNNLLADMQEQGTLIPDVL